MKILSVICYTACGLIKDVPVEQDAKDQKEEEHIPRLNDEEVEFMKTLERELKKEFKKGIPFLITIYGPLFK